MTTTITAAPAQRADVAALPAHIMRNTALTGATYDVHVGQHVVG
ncbi:MAG TPA: hypothetical protein VGL78_05265 [Solirubrobacteraceae bacterium]|jgi:hypothetical protein